MVDARSAILDVLYGRWRSQTLYAGVALGIFDEIGERPKAASAIADRLGLDPHCTYRLLRALASIEVLREHESRRFSLTATGALLSSDHPQSLRDLTLLRECPEHYAIWKHLPAIVREGKQDGFLREFGCTAFEYAARVPQYAKNFDRGMSGLSIAQTPCVLEALERCDLRSISLLCDIGGGQGHLLAHFLARYSHLHGVVLDRAAAFDEVDALWASRLNVSERCRYVAGDMFADVPPADAYFLKMILHDWDDRDCVQILRTAHKQASASGRVFIAEHIIPDIDTPHVSKLFDLHMMCWGPGRERTVSEYAELLHAAGWNYVANWSARDSAIGVIEGEKL